MERRHKRSNERFDAVAFANGFTNREQAGQELAKRLLAEHLPNPVVLGLARGGVPVAAEVARALDAPLEVFIARKLGAPGQPEFAIGAIAEGGISVLDDPTIRALGLSPADMRALREGEEAELARRVAQYRGRRRLPELHDRTAILVDDGLATGWTAAAALTALRQRGPRRLVLAVPVCTPDTKRRLQTTADEVFCVIAASRLGAVGDWYADFRQTTDDRVIELLNDDKSRR